MLVSAAALTVALSACTSGGGGSPTTSAPSSAPTTGTATTATSTTTPGGATGTGSGTTKAPDPAASAAASSAAIAGIPAAAKAHTPAGAEAFTRYFMDQVAVAWTKPQVGAITSLSEPDCRACAAFEKTAHDYVTTGTRLAHAPTSIAWLGAGTSVEGKQSVSFRGTQVANQVVRPGGEVAARIPKVDLKAEVLLTPTADGWRVYEMAKYQ